MLDQEEIDALLERLDNPETSGYGNPRLVYLDDYEALFDEDDVRILVKLYREATGRTVPK